MATATSRRIYDSPAWRATRRAVLERDGYTCQVQLRGCTRIATTADHIIGLADGGEPYDPANVRACCKQCNSARSMKRLHDSQRYGPALPGWW